MKARFREKLAAGEFAYERWRFMTLTVRSTPFLGQQIHDLRSAWRRIRNQAWFKRLVTGGLFAIDITETERGWHAHIHAIITGAFVPHQKLRTEWKALTGAPIVGVQAVTSTPAALSYLLHELRKVPRVIHADEYRSGVKHLRLIDGFGIYYKAAQHMKQPKHSKRCPFCGGTNVICVDFADALEYEAIYAHVDNEDYDDFKEAPLPLLRQRPSL